MTDVDHSSGMLKGSEPPEETELETNDPKADEPHLSHDAPAAETEGVITKPKLEIDPAFAEEMHKRQAEEHAAREKLIAEEQAKKEQAEKERAEAEKTGEKKTPPDISKIYPTATEPVAPTKAEEKPKEEPTRSTSSSFRNSLFIGLALSIIGAIVYGIYFSNYFLTESVVYTLKYSALAIAVITLIFLYARAGNAGYDGDNMPKSYAFMFSLATVAPAVIIGLTIASRASIMAGLGTLFIGPLIGFGVGAVIQHIFLKKFSIHPKLYNTAFKIILFLIFYGVRIWSINFATSNDNTIVIMTDAGWQIIWQNIGIYAGCIAITDVVSMLCFFGKIS